MAVPQLLAHCSLRLRYTLEFADRTFLVQCHAIL
jgi:hypothetical protein